jgi:hypothetical protein
MNEHTQGPWLAPKPFAGGRFEVIGGTHIDTRQVAVGRSPVRRLPGRRGP